MAISFSRKRRYPFFNPEPHIIPEDDPSEYNTVWFRTILFGTCMYGRIPWREEYYGVHYWIAAYRNKQNTSDGRARTREYMPTRLYDTLTRSPAPPPRAYTKMYELGDLIFHPTCSCCRQPYRGITPHPSSLATKWPCTQPIMCANGTLDVTLLDFFGLKMRQMPLFVRELAIAVSARVRSTKQLYIVLHVVLMIVKVTCFDCLRYKFQYPNTVLNDGLCLYCDGKAALYDVDRWGTLHDYIYIYRVYIEYQREKLVLKLHASSNGVLSLEHWPARTYDNSMFKSPPPIEGPAVRPRLDNIKQFADAVTVRCTNSHKLYTHGKEPLAGDGVAFKLGTFYDICKYCYHRSRLQEVVRHQYGNGQYGWRVRDHNGPFQHYLYDHNVPSHNVQF
jgi:hypothetical protein